ncbi:hypothetical protein ABH925_003090 [Streptacidiphilus sp. EB129]
MPNCAGMAVSGRTTRFPDPGQPPCGVPDHPVPRSPLLRNTHAISPVRLASADQNGSRRAGRRSPDPWTGSGVARARRRLGPTDTDRRLRSDAGGPGDRHRHQLRAHRDHPRGGRPAPHPDPAAGRLRHRHRQALPGLLLPARHVGRPGGPLSRLPRTARRHLDDHGHPGRRAARLVRQLARPDHRRRRAELGELPPRPGDPVRRRQPAHRRDQAGAGGRRPVDGRVRRAALRAGPPRSVQPGRHALRSRRPVR